MLGGELGGRWPPNLLARTVPMRDEGNDLIAGLLEEVAQGGMADELVGEADDAQSGAPWRRADGGAGWVTAETALQAPRAPRW